MGAPAYKLAPRPAAAFDGGRLRICASAPVPDMDGEVVLADTIDLDQYRRNPVVLYGHDAKGMPVARAARVWVENGELWQEWEFADTDAGREVAKLYRDGVLRGASIGFRDFRAEDVGPDEAERLYGVRKRLRRLVGGTLYETSAVPVPSCPAALADRWVDAGGAAAAVERGASAMVTKSFAPVLRGRPPAPAAPSTIQTEGTTVSQAATKEPDDALPGADAPDGGATPDAPDAAAAVTAGLRQAMHDSVDALADGDLTWDEFTEQLQQLHADHGKYGGTAAGDAGDADKGDDPDDDDAMKSFLAESRSFMAEVRAKFADQQSFNETVEAALLPMVK